MGKAGNCCPGDNWQYCRSLDDAMAPVRSVYGPSGLVLSRLRFKCGVRRYPQRSGRLQGVGLTLLGVVLDGVSFLFVAALPIRGRLTRKA